MSLPLHPLPRPPSCRRSGSRHRRGRAASPSSSRTRPAQRCDDAAHGHGNRARRVRRRWLMELEDRLRRLRGGDAHQTAPARRGPLRVMARKPGRVADPLYCQKGDERGSTRLAAVGPRGAQSRSGRVGPSVDLFRRLSLCGSLQNIVSLGARRHGFCLLPRLLNKSRKSLFERLGLFNPAACAGHLRP